MMTLSTKCWAFRKNIKKTALLTDYYAGMSDDFSTKVAYSVVWALTVVVGPHLYALAYRIVVLDLRWVDHTRLLVCPILCNIKCKSGQYS